MQLIKGHEPAKDIPVSDLYGRTVLVHSEAYDWEYAPSLGAIHQWFWGDWGPESLNWKDGWLCPFNSQVGRKNMTCCAGARGDAWTPTNPVRHCAGRGLYLPKCCNHLAPKVQRQIKGRVHCYAWGHRIGNAYWDWTTEHKDELLALDDADIGYAAILILRNSLRLAGWFDWAREPRMRARFKSYERRWLQPLEPQNFTARHG